MRLLIYMLSVVSAGFVFGAHAEDMVLKTNCDKSLQKRMMADPRVEGTCFATVSVNGQTVTKNFHAAIKIDKTADGSEASLAINEFCESCKTSGPVEKQALDYSKLSSWALAKATQSLAKGENVSARVDSTEEDDEPEVEVAYDSCASKSNASDRLSCQISKLNNESDVKKMREYYLATVQPELQKLVVSKKETDQATLRQAILVLLTNAKGITDADTAIKSSVYEFNAFLEMRHYAALDKSAPYREMIKTKYETIFRDRPKYNKANGVQSESLDGNSRLLLKLVGEELGTGGDKSIASADGPSASTNPRGQFGTPGLQQGRGFTPPTPRSGAAGSAACGINCIFHKN